MKHFKYHPLNSPPNLGGDTGCVYSYTYSLLAPPSVGGAAVG